MLLLKQQRTRPGRVDESRLGRAPRQCPARIALGEARRRVRTLERMELAHVEAEQEAELKHEQNRLDEIASGRVARGEED